MIPLGRGQGQDPAPGQEQNPINVFEDLFEDSDDDMSLNQCIASNEQRAERRGIQARLQKFDAWVKANGYDLKQTPTVTEDDMRELSRLRALDTPLQSSTPSPAVDDDNRLKQLLQESVADLPPSKLPQVKFADENEWDQAIKSSSTAPVTATITSEPSLLVGAYNLKARNTLCIICRLRVLNLCPSCSVNFKYPCDATIGTCDHVFHTHCIEKWLPRSNRCPMDNQPWEKKAVSAPTVDLSRAQSFT